MAVAAAVDLRVFGITAILRECLGQRAEGMSEIKQCPALALIRLHADEEAKTTGITDLDADRVDKGIEGVSHAEEWIIMP